MQGKRPEKARSMGEKEQDYLDALRVRRQACYFGACWYC